MSFLVAVVTEVLSSAIAIKCSTISATICFSHLCHLTYCILL
uniref:Uncharacterized protein n=1 Tax=Arundo donax TaxID=35708 RepID=A0A0A9BMP1_ARUDO